MAIEAWRYGDPAMVLERRGEDCTHCLHLEQWDVIGKRLAHCTNPRAPQQRKAEAQQRRCDEWQHKGETRL